MAQTAKDVWLAAGVPAFAKVDTAQQCRRHCCPCPWSAHDGTAWDQADFAVSNVVPNLTEQHRARNFMDAVSMTVPAYSTVMACSTSMMGVFKLPG